MKFSFWKPDASAERMATAQRTLEAIKKLPTAVTPETLGRVGIGVDQIEACVANLDLTPADQAVILKIAQMPHITSGLEARVRFVDQPIRPPMPPRERLQKILREQPVSEQEYRATYERFMGDLRQGHYPVFAVGYSVDAGFGGFQLKDDDPCVPLVSAMKDTHLGYRKIFTPAQSPGLMKFYKRVGRDTFNAFAGDKDVKFYSQGAHVNRPVVGDLVSFPELVHAPTRLREDLALNDQQKDAKNQGIYQMAVTMADVYVAIDKNNQGGTYRGVEISDHAIVRAYEQRCEAAKCVELSIRVYLSPGVGKTSKRFSELRIRMPLRLSGTAHESLEQGSSSPDSYAAFLRMMIKNPRALFDATREAFPGIYQLTEGRFYYPIEDDPLDSRAPRNLQLFIPEFQVIGLSYKGPDNAPLQSRT